LVKEGTY